MSVRGVLPGEPDPPEPREVWRLPRDAYDEYDSADHPLLVVKVRSRLRDALVVTRTSKPHAKGPLPVVHAASERLDFDRVGWWRLHKRMPVKWTAFADEDAEFLGLLEDDAWARVLRVYPGAQS